MKKKILALFLNYTGILWFQLFWMRIFGSKKLRILCYHRVMDIDPERFELDDDLVDAKVSDFERQMRFISRHFNAISFEMLIKYKKNGRLPKNSLIITFDDGYRDNYTETHPVLKKFGFPIAVFLTTGFIGAEELFWWDRLAYIIKKTTKKEVCFSLNGEIYRYGFSTPEERLLVIMKINTLIKKLEIKEIEGILDQMEDSLNVSIDSSFSRGLILSWDDIRKMSENNVEFGSHSVHHQLLTILSSEEVKDEIAHSKRDLEQMLSKPSIVFAYPYGLYNSNCLTALKETGIEFSCSYKNSGINSIKDLQEHPYELKRMSVDYNENMKMFKARLCFPRLMSLTIKKGR